MTFNANPIVLTVAGSLNFYASFLDDQDVVERRARRIAKILPIDAINALVEKNIDILVSPPIEGLSQFGQVRLFEDGKMLLCMDPFMIRTLSVDHLRFGDDGVTAAILSLIEAAILIGEKYDGECIELNTLTLDEHRRIQTPGAEYLKAKGHIKSIDSRVDKLAKRTQRMADLQETARTVGHFLKRRIQALKA